LHNQKNRKIHWAEKSEKPPSLLTKTENQQLHWRKCTNHTRHQNRKIAVFLSAKTENRTKNWPNAQNRKSQRPPPVILLANFTSENSSRKKDKTVSVQRTNFRDYVFQKHKNH